jgi:aminotransferase/cystathionine beta-lyase
MDFACAPCVTEAMTNRIQHGVFGYTHAPHDFKEKIAQHLLNQYQWQVDPSWIVVLPSVVSGLYTAARQLSQIDEHLLVPKPVYHHLRLAALQAPRDFSEIALVNESGRLVFSLKELDLHRKSNTSLLYLCNPQNPGGTVYTRNELTDIANYCIKNNLTICSDEIHAGLILDKQKKHIPIASLNEEIANRTVTLMSLNKTFNFPGEGLAWVVAKNPELRNAMQVDLHATIPEPSLLSYTATNAALKQGEPWRLELISYLQENLKLIEERVRQLPKLSLFNTEASYLAWIDCSNLGIEKPEEHFLNHGVALSPGSQFGAPNFVRLNFGTQRSRLIEALDRISQAAQ